jgi:hypothetical protein
LSITKSGPFVEFERYAIEGEGAEAGLVSSINAHQLSKKIKASGSPKPDAFTSHFPRKEN